MLEDDALEAPRRARYAKWDSVDYLDEGSTLDGVAARAEGLDPQPVSGRQERLENIVNRYV
jgi:xylose isomerase